MSEGKLYVAEGPFAVQSAEWHAHRAKTIGASEVAAVLGVPGAFKTPLQVWADKRQAMLAGVVDEPEESLKEMFHFGHALEPIIAEEFAARTGFFVEEEDRQFVSIPYPFLGCSLDRWFIPDRKLEKFRKDSNRGPLELKNSSVFMRERWEEGIYLPYQVQVQAQMAVTGAEVGAVAVLIGGNQFKWALVERNQRFIDAMLEKLERFWEMVQNDVMPEPMAADSKLIGTLVGHEEPGISVALSGHWVEVDEELLRVKDEIKALTSRKDELEAKIKKEIGKAERGVLPSGGQYVFKTVERQAYSVPASETRQLRRIK